jgi:hypothetical protein
MRARSTQGSQAPLRDFDQLVEGPGPISTSCPPGGLWGRGSAFWRENWSKHPPFRAHNFDQLVEVTFKISEISGLRPSHFDPSTSLRALVQRLLPVAIARKGVSTPPVTCPLPRGGRVNDCSWLKRIDKRVRDDRDARVATQLQPNHESFEFGPLRPCSL